MNSILDWKNKLPKDWEAIPLKAVASYSVSSVDKLTKDDEIPVELCNYVDVYKNDFIVEESGFMNATATEEEIKKYSLETGDVLITKDSESWDDIGVPALVTFSRENLLCGYHLAIIKPTPNRLNSEFLLRCIQSKEIRIQLELVSTGVTRFGLPKDEIGRLILPIPTIKIQERVVEYLDNEITRIDLLIFNKGRLLNKLSEKCQALITHSVTKGLNSEAKMKNSSIRWMGEIPKHWTIKKIKHITDKIGSGVTPKGGAEVYQTEGVPILRSQNIHFDGLKLDDVAYISEEIHQSMSNSKVKIGDVLLNITGASIGRCYYFEGQYDEANVNQHVCILRPNRSIITEYLYLFVSSDLGQTQISLSQVGGGREGLNFESLKDFSIPLPSIKEQKEITQYVQKIKTKISTLEKRTTQTIELLKEKRSSLITALVTGQKRLS